MGEGADAPDESAVSSLPCSPDDEVSAETVSYTVYDNEYSSPAVWDDTGSGQ